MSKQVHFGDDARKDIFQGIKLVADAVKVTLGPKGKNVMIDRGF
jgi:chaperonin GroEL